MKKVIAYELSNGVLIKDKDEAIFEQTKLDLGVKDLDKSSIGLIVELKSKIQSDNIRLHDDLILGLLTVINKIKLKRDSSEIIIDINRIYDKLYTYLIKS